MLFDMRRNDWDDELLQLLDVPRELLPAVHPSSHVYGATRPELLGARDRRSAASPATSRARCSARPASRPGQVKNTYGTGCFMLMHTGEQLRDLRPRPDHDQRGADRRATPEYALEGSVFIGGAVVQWLRDGLQAIKASGEVQALAESVPDSGGVMFVPAFTGLGAPYWKRRCARRDRRADARQHGRAHRARRAREHRVPERRAARTR